MSKTRPIVMPFARISAAEHARIFGTPAEINARRVEALKEQKRIQAAQGDIALLRNVPAIHDDRDWGHKGVYSDSLGLTVTSRTHQKQLEKRLNVQATN